MTLKEIAMRIDKTNKNEDTVCPTDFDEEFDHNFSYGDQDSLKSYWMGNWCCTDTCVGYKMYFLNDEPVAVSTQPGRKCDVNIEWFSEELALKVRDYLLSLEIEKDKFCFQIEDINHDIGDGYRICYNNQIINNDKAMLNNQHIKILEHIKDEPDYGIGSTLKVELSNGDSKTVDVKDLRFAFNLSENSNLITDEK